MGKVNWLLIGAGALLATGSLVDMVPADEIAGVPIGALLIAKGAGVI